MTRTLIAALIVGTSLVPAAAAASPPEPPVIHESFTPLPCPRHPKTTVDLEACAEKAILEPALMQLRALVVVLSIAVALSIAAASSFGAARGQPIREVRWNSAAVPGSTCGAAKAIHLHAGTAVVVSARWLRYGYRKVTVYREEHVSYGDLDGDGQDEAGLGIVCANNGGTAAGQLAFAQVIFRLVHGVLHVVGIVTPRRRPARGAHPSLVTVQIVPGRVVATEYFYGPHDGDCCPSGRARTIWRYAGGRLHPGHPVVTRASVK